MRRNSRTWLAILLAAVFIVAACGQKSGVSVSAGGGIGGGDSFAGGDDLGEGGDGAGAGDVSGGTGDVSGGTSTGGGTTGGGTTSGGTTSGGTRTTTRTGSTGGTGGGSTAGPDRTGIDDAKKTIRIGIHAPVTGAAPIEQKTFDYGKDVYWKWLRDNNGLLGGYNVEVVFEDDTFDPVTARNKCAKMVESDKVFLLVGGAGADQITACANYANQKGVPYISAGVNEEGLDGLRTYFAISQTYSQQSPMLAQLIKSAKVNKQKVGLVVLDTRSFADARTSALKAFQQAGLEVVADKRLPKDSTESQASAAAGEMQDAGAEVVYVLTSPTIFLYMTNGASRQGYAPFWVGPGITNGLNLVAQIGCPGVNNSYFLSPFPQMDAIGEMDPNYTQAYNTYVTSQNPQQRADDIGIALWGLAKTIHQMFNTVGNAKDLSRQSFMAGVASGKTLQTNVYPPVRFSQTDRFGADSAHLLKSDCINRRFTTDVRFAKSF